MASFLSGLVDVTVTCNVSVASRSCAQARSEKILHCKVSFNFNFNFNFIHSLSIYNYTIASTRVYESLIEAGEETHKFKERKEKKELFYKQYQLSQNKNYSMY